MFRWIKGGKNKSKSSKEKSTCDNYGFNNQSNPCSANYGFSRAKSTENLDSSVHIYHEISDVTEMSFSRQFTLLPDETHTGNNVEGPYLVVPILPARRPSVSRNPGQLEATQVSLADSYNDPWDKPKHENDRKENISYSHPAYRDTISSYTCSSVSMRTDSDRAADSDTGCEYDMSTSAESDVSSEYKELINKIENNLTLKHQILQMIKESEKNEIEPKKLHHSKDYKKTSCSSLDSCDLHRPQDIPEIGETESEYSSGFDEIEISGNTNFSSGSVRNESRTSHLSIQSNPSDIKNTRSQSRKLAESYTQPTQRYNIPHNNSQTKRNSRNNSSLVPKPSNGYYSRNPSSNRLLGDLINMNHNMQTLKF